jgi:lipoprotein-anchoring transpeptidase ErfK/SrfK
MRCVVNGKTVVSTSVVTGTTSTGHGTPTGTYYILYKSRDTTLKGSNTDGSKYATKVKYWMPFYAGDGFHDAWWRSSFGGSIYVSGGSHGCVNMPSSQAASLYNYVSAGMPVVIHG